MQVHVPMAKKYTFCMKFIVLLLMGCFALFIGYKFYKKIENNDFIVLKERDLSINYLGNKSFSVKNEKNELRFSVTNDSDNDAIYTIKLEDISNFDKDAKITLFDGDNSFNIESTNEKQKILLDNVTIKPKATKNYKITAENYSNDTLSFDIIITEGMFSENTIATSILANNEIKKIATKIAVENSLEDEGLIEDFDDNGIIYYFRGNVQNNYVSFANNIWRIVRINGDGTVRIVLDGLIEGVTSYTDNADDISFENSKVKKALDDWYSINMEEYDKYVAKGRFCDDINLSSDSTSFNNYTRVFINNIPSFNCLGDVVLSKVGLLTIDDVIYAGAGVKESNLTYYLYKKDVTNYWLMSMGSIKKNNYCPFTINSNGEISSSTSTTSSQKIRPVINLASDIVVEGNGTIDNPYVVKE